jgi:hypothetical protein
MYFTKTRIPFKATGGFSCEDGRFTLQESTAEVALVAWEAAGNVVPLVVQSVRNPVTFEELDADLWALEPVGQMLENQVRYLLKFDGETFSESLARANFAVRDTLHQSLLFGGQVELTVIDGNGNGLATHIYLDLSYGARVDK